MDRRFVCANKHSFDIARSGYLNLLQPQDRRSKHPGDAPAAVAARRSLHEMGVTQPLLAGIGQVIGATERDAILDIGAGDGFYLGSLAGQSNGAGTGIDISIPAMDAAARRYPGCRWIVANADRFVPCPDGSFGIVLSITGRMNRDEFHRVLEPGGKLLIALPAPDDLIELRGTGRDRTARTIKAFLPKFTLVNRSRVTTSAELEAGAVENILLSIYRPMQAKAAVAMRVRLSLDLLLFRAA